MDYSSQPHAIINGFIPEFYFHRFQHRSRPLILTEYLKLQT